MQKRNNSSGIEYEKPNWDWSPIQCTLKMTQNGRKSVQWQLAPSILLTNPLSNESDPNVRLFIDTEKSLTYSPDLGWNWHKSWNLPNISIRLQIKDEVTGEQLLSPKNIFAQIFAVKKNGDNDRSDKLILQDVGIRGENKMEMIDGQVYFSAMKFSSTTYNNEGQNFHLLIAIYIQQNQLEKPKILTAVISPEIFVDSRRSARDYQQKKFNSFVEPFCLDQLDKQFIKRENKNRTDQEIEIQNDAEGFYNYLTAPNIRHKVKHPIFLAIRFSNCATIFYNWDKFSEEEIPEEEKAQNYIMESLQKRLLKQSQSKNGRQENLNTVVSEKYFLISVRNIPDSLKRKKVLESIESLESESIGVIYEDKETNQSFKKLPQSTTLTELYKECYQALRDICRRYVPSDADSSQEESEDEYAQKQEENNRKNLKISKMESGVGITYSSQSRRGKPTNMICKTISTPDKNKLKQQNVNRAHNSYNQSDNASMIKEVKEEQIYQQSPEDPQNIMPTIRQNLPSSNNNQNHFSLDIGSKKGSAFNNLRPGMSTLQNSEKVEKPSNQNINNLYKQNNNQNQDINYNEHLLSQLGLNPYNMGNANLGSLLGLAGNGVGGNNGLGGNAGLGGNNGLGLGNLGALGLGGLGLGNLGNLGLGQQLGLQQNNNNPQQNQQNSQGFNQGGLGGLGQQNLGLLGGLGGLGLGGYPGYNMNLNQLLGQSSNLMLSNWINSQKMNGNLESLLKQQSGNIGDDKKQQLPNLYDQSQDLLRGLNPQLQQQQSILFLLQQINLYRELLAQITYQNSLLQRNMNNIHNSNNQTDESEEKKPKQQHRQ